MKYSSLNQSALKVTKKALSLFWLLNINPKSMITVKPIPKIEEYGFIGVQVLVNDYLLSLVTIDTYNNNIVDTKVALQYLSTRINKLFESNVEFYGKYL